jgi:hypothetical protein
MPFWPFFQDAPPLFRPTYPRHAIRFAGFRWCLFAAIVLLGQPAGFSQSGATAPVNDPAVVLPTGTQPQKSPESEIIFEGLGSFGHYHVFAYSWWSYLDVAGVEYDRHTWGNFIGARMDYVAEILPVVLLRQPAKTDVWGDPLSKDHKINPGIGISPIGLRMLWRDGKNWKPYYEVKGGMVGFTHKALSDYAAYQNFSLQQSIGIQFRVTPQWDFRAGVTDFHFSDAFMVPSNPGIDEMSYSGGICYHLGRPAVR